MRPRLPPLVALVVLAAAVGAGAALSAVPRSAPDLPSALASMPAETLTASVTDWGRLHTLSEDVGPGGPAERQALLDRAYETDLSAVSVLGEMADVMVQRYGWSVFDAEWEGLAQSRQGAAVIVQLPPDFDLGGVRESLADLGYREPFESDGVWRGGTDLVAGVDGSLTPLMAHAAVLDDTNRVVFSDNAPYVGRTVDVIEGSRASLGQDESVAAVADRLEGAAAAVVLAGDHGCQVMGFSRASSGDRVLAHQRVADVGGVAPYASAGLGLMPGPDGGLRRAPLVVAMHFADTRAVAGEASRRARLAVGEAPVQGGTYQSRFAVESAHQRGGDVVLRLRPREADAQLLSDLGSGELLFASCR